MAVGGAVMVLVTLYVTDVTASCPAGPSGPDSVVVGTERFAYGYSVFSAVSETPGCNGPFSFGVEGNSFTRAQQVNSIRSINTQKAEIVDMIPIDECNRSVLVKLPRL